MLKTKKELRRFFLSSHRYDDAPPCIDASALLAFLSKQKSVSVIGSYYALGAHEVDLSLLHREIINQADYRLAFPVMDGDEMHFQIDHQLENFEKGAFGFKQPKLNKEVCVIPDLFLVPALAFDQEGNRLGRGQGHYDRFFSKYGRSLYKIGVTYHQNFIEKLVNELHDVKMNAIITEKGFFPV